MTDDDRSVLPGIGERVRFVFGVLGDDEQTIYEGKVVRNFGDAVLLDVGGESKFISLQMIEDIGSCQIEVIEARSVMTVETQGYL